MLSFLENTTGTGDVRMDIDNEHGFIIVLMTGILGSIACVLGMVYYYIYCIKMKRRRRPRFQEGRINYYIRDPAIQYGHQTENDQQDRTPIKVHPFFVVSYISKFKRNAQSQNKFEPSTSSIRR